jgi:predicted RNase H-like HicB family nuclease
MIRRYAVVYEPGPTSFGAHVPDLPGCVAVAKTREEVERLIREAIEFHLEGMRLNNEATPEPTNQVGYVEIDMARVEATVAAERAGTTPD